MINRIKCGEGCMGWMGVATGEDGVDMRDGASYKTLLLCRYVFTNIIYAVLYKISDNIVIDAMRSYE
jgi:hypothetical protein